MHVQNKPKCIEVLARRNENNIYVLTYVIYAYTSNLLGLQKPGNSTCIYRMKRPAFHSSDHALLRYTNKVYFGVHFEHNSTQTAHFE